MSQCCCQRHGRKFCLPYLGKEQIGHIVAIGPVKPTNKIQLIENDNIEPTFVNRFSVFFFCVQKKVTDDVCRVALRKSEWVQNFGIPSIEHHPNLLGNERFACSRRSI